MTYRRPHRPKGPVVATPTHKIYRDIWDEHKSYQNDKRVQVMQPTMADFDRMSKAEWQRTKNLYPAGTVYRIDGKERIIEERFVAEEMKL